MNRNDFFILKENLIYLDNAATTLKPDFLINAISDCYQKYPANIGRGQYDISKVATKKYEQSREVVAKFLGADNSSEIVFTSGTTDSINKIIFGFFKNYLKKGDEVLLTESEHASLLLPWFELADKLGLVIKYIPLTTDYKVKLTNIQKLITPSTKVISLAHVTNVIGDVRPIKEICELAQKNNILTLIDGAQSVPHMKINVKNLGVDFYAFSAHKMLGPNGVGVIFGKKQLLDQTKPIIYGGGMNASFTKKGERKYLEVPQLLEPGTPNITDVIAFGEVIKYLSNIDIDKIYKHEKELRDYTVKQLSRLNNINLYNPTSESGIVIFNVKGISADEVAKYLNKHNICIRTGRHCAKIIDQILGVESTCRISLYFYNIKEEIDFLVLALKHLKINYI